MDYRCSQHWDEASATCYSETCFVQPVVSFYNTGADVVKLFKVLLSFFGGHFILCTICNACKGSFHTFSGCGGTTCKVHQTCHNNNCVCGDMCTDDYTPVCGRSTQTGAVYVFSNMCYLNMYACNHEEIFIVVPEAHCNTSGLFFY